MKHSNEIVKTDATTIAKMVSSQEVPAREVLEAFLERISKYNDALRAFVYADIEGARTRASEIDREVKRGTTYRMAGVPIAVKDVISVKGLPLTCGSKILRGYVPPYDATVIARLRKAGCVIVGMTNTDEFAMGSSTENSAYGPSINPWMQSRVPGGSSGGSAVAVAAGMAAIGLGSDTGGSVRLPASFVGVYGLKPSYGAVSRFGLVAFSNSIEQVGLFARSIGDLKLAYSVISGADPLDGTTLTFDWNLTTEEGTKANVFRAGKVIEMSGEGVEPPVLEALDRTVETLKRYSIQIENVNIPHLVNCLAAYYLIAMSEASSNLARFDGVRYGSRVKTEGNWNEEYSRIRALFGSEVKRRVILGAHALSSGFFSMYYDKAARFRTLIKSEFESAFRNYDLLIGPTSPSPAFRLGERTLDPVQMYLSDVDTVPMNLTGVPALSVPTGFANAEGGLLPVATQLIAPYGREDTIFGVASLLEKAGLSTPKVVNPWGNIL